MRRHSLLWRARRRHGPASPAPPPLPPSRTRPNKPCAYRKRVPWTADPPKGSHSVAKQADHSLKGPTTQSTATLGVLMGRGTGYTCEEGWDGQRKPSSKTRRHLQQPPSPHPHPHTEPFSLSCCHRTHHGPRQDRMPRLRGAAQNLPQRAPHRTAGPYLDGDEVGLAASAGVRVVDAVRERDGEPLRTRTATPTQVNEARPFTTDLAQIQCQTHMPAPSHKSTRSAGVVQSG